MQTIIQKQMDRNIVLFLTDQTVMTIATCNNNIPHCAMCFYVFDALQNIIIFKSKPTTQHIKEASENNIVAGTVLPDQFNPGKTSGIQFTGVFKPAELYTNAAKQYYKKYPFAAIMPGEVWIIELNNIVFTDATLGIGKKRKWEREVC